MNHLAASRPIPGSPPLNLSLFFIQSLPQPVLKNTASPSLMSDSCMFCFCRAAFRSATVISCPASIIAPFRASRSNRWPRVKNGFTFSMPSFFMP